MWNRLQSSTWQPSCVPSKRPRRLDTKCSWSQFLGQARRKEKLAAPKAGPKPKAAKPKVQPAPKQVPAPKPKPQPKAEAKAKAKGKAKRAYQPTEYGLAKKVFADWRHVMISNFHAA